MPPLVISHRACGGHAPENTLTGIRTALRLGADAVEIDVQGSADGVPVLMHDSKLDRTTNGTGELASRTLEQLRALDAGGEPVPTFAQALEITQRNALLVTEIKRPGCEPALADIIRAAQALDDVTIWSFLPSAIEAMRQAEQRVSCGLLVAPESIGDWPSMLKLASRLGLQAVSVFHTGLDQDTIAEAKSRGLAVHAWTADTKSDIQRLIELGVDGIVTNYPDRVLALLGRPHDDP